MKSTLTCIHNGLLILGLSYTLANGFARAVITEDISGVAEASAAAD